MEKLFFESNEKDFIKYIDNTLSKENFKRSSSVTTEETINEGLKFFKASPRLYKLANKLERKGKQNPKVLQTAKKVNDLANEFEYAEDLYDVGRKEEAKAQYKELKEKYNSLLKLLQKQDIKDALKKVSALGITIASMTIPYMAMQHFFPQLSLTAVNAAAQTASTKDVASLYLKRAGAFTLCGLPIKAARGILQGGSEIYDDQILKSVDRMLA